MVQTLLTAACSATITGIIMFILQWVRYKKKDKSEQENIDAQTAKIKAEAIQIEAQAQFTVADAALKLAQRLGEECDLTKTQLHKALVELANVTQKLNEVQRELTRQVEKNNQMVIELGKLTAEMNKWRPSF
jgi:hypothetical protein